nr:catecholate siderophore receptor CirA [Klebsiella pneumoniae]
MKILSVRHAALPALLLPLIAAARAADEQTMVVTAAPTTVSELDTPAAVSVVNGDEMRRAAPRVNLSESLGAVPGLQVQNRQNYARICSCRFAALARAQPMACADCASMWMAFRPPCPTARGRPQILISAALTPLRCCAALLCPVR